MSAKVLFVSDNFPPVVGGSAVVYDQLCKNNAEWMIGLSSEYTYEKQYKDELKAYDLSCGFPIKRLPYLRKKNTSDVKSRFFRNIQSAKEEIITYFNVSRSLIGLCRKENIAAVLVGELDHGGWIALFAKYVLRKPVVIYTHGEEISQVRSGFHNRLHKFYLEKADLIIAVSLFCKSQVVSLFGIDPEKIGIISNGVDLDVFKPAPRNEGLTKSLGVEGKKIIFSIGRHVERKGFDHLIECLPAVLEAIPEVHLLIGGTGPLTERLHSLVGELGLQGSVSFIGRIPDDELADYYRLADVFVMANRTMEDGGAEGFGLVFLEANACGIPVVGGTGGGAIEAVVDGITGFTVDGSFPGQIAKALITLLRDDALRRRMGQAGLELARLSSWKSCAAEFSDLVRRFLTDEWEGDHGTSWGRVEPAILADPPSRLASKKLLMTVDFEESFDWDNTSRSGHVVQGIPDLKVFQERCRSAGIAPTYLATYSVLKTASAVDFLSAAVRDGGCEVGIHPHVWNTPPKFEASSDFNTFQCNLPSHLERKKLENIITLYQEIFGVPPTVHRAGRYGVNAGTLRLLEDLGIRLDLSPSARFDFSHMGGPNFSGLSNRPFWATPRHELLCLPVPGVEFYRGPDALTKLANGKSGLFGLIFHKATVRLSPEGNSLDRMKIVADRLLAEGLPFIHISLHSTSLTLGGNPYSRNVEGRNQTFETVFEFVHWLRSVHDIEPIQACGLRRLVVPEQPPDRSRSGDRKRT
jgi:glycosyltransferase involved in cell wall biosynthesis